MRGLLFILALLVCLLSVARADLTEEDKSKLNILSKANVVSIYNKTENVEELLLKEIKPYTVLFVLDTGDKMICKAGKQNHYGMDMLNDEIFAFYLDRLLGLHQVPPAIITSFGGKRWKKVRKNPWLLKKDMKWKRNDQLVCSLWLEDLTVAKWPESLILRKDSNMKVTEKRISSWTASEQQEIVQWGDVIGFDFVSGCSERILVSFKHHTQLEDGKMAWSESQNGKWEITNAFRNKEGKIMLTDNNGCFFYERHSLEGLDGHMKNYCVYSPEFKAALFRHADTIAKDMYELVQTYEPEAPTLNYVRGNILRNRAMVLASHIQNDC